MYSYRINPICGISRLFFILLLLNFCSTIGAHAQTDLSRSLGEYILIYDSTYIWPDGKGGVEYTRKYMSRVVLGEEGRSMLSGAATPVIDKSDQLEFDAYTMLPDGEIFEVGLNDVENRELSDNSRRIFVNFRHAEPGAMLHFEWELHSQKASMAGKRFFGRTIPVDSSVIVMTFPEPWVFNFSVSPEIRLKEELTVGDRVEDLYPVSIKWTAMEVGGLIDEKYTPLHDRLIPGLYYSIFFDKSWTDEEKREIDWDYISQIYRQRLQTYLGSGSILAGTADSLRSLYDNPQKLAITAFDWVKRNFRSRKSEITFGPDIDDSIELGRGTQAEAAAIFYDLAGKLGIETGIYLASTRNTREPIPDLPALFWFDRLIAACFIENDTLWADPYYSVSDLGILPFEDQGVSILRVDMDKKTLESTPELDYHENGKAIHLKLYVDSLGSLSGEATEVYSGAMVPEISTNLLGLDEPQRKSMWEKDLGKSLPDVNFDKFGIAPPDSFGKPFIIYYSFTTGPIIRPFVKRAYLPMDFLGRWEDLPDLPPGDRLFPIAFPRPRFELERITFEISPKFNIESIPKNFSINSHIGEIYSVARQNENSITVTRGFGLKRPIYPVSSYKSVVKFFNAAREEASKRIIIRRAE